MHWILIATFIIIGLVFLALEILVIPGVGVAGIIGFILIAVGVWQAYAVHGMIAGHSVLGGTLALTVLTLVLSLRGKTWKRLSLSTSINSKVNVIDGNKVKPGDTGKTVSRLAPMGKAMINGEFYEVSTNGDFIDQQTDIIVLKVDYNKIIVKRKDLK
jgi:membrane-bound ClpP family serine protease